VITRRGKPAAVLSPVVPRRRKGKGLAGIKGWLSNNDPFFKLLDEIRRESRSIDPRSFRI
jgi:antitoxin (DNA-binding transcriptional repressor) of toxin-antitoxin stability system